MPQKSRRNRRNISAKSDIRSSQQIQNSPTENVITDTPLNYAVSQIDNNSKSSITSNLDLTHTANEIKWIIFTTAIVAVLLALAYVFLR
jgi:hypothetical protein